MNKIEALSSSIEEFEFDIACTYAGCDKPAIVSYRISHSKRGCWSPGSTHCKLHYEMKKNELLAFIDRCQRLKRRCVRCHQFPAGVLKDNMQVIPL